jgi:thymidylate kinase
MFSKKVTIFEGCDGSGKSTAAQRFAADTGARYVHLGPFPRVYTGLPRLYAEAMLPALLGYQDVVMDRSWLSEPIYGAAYRNGTDRVGGVSRMMLERLALRCGAIVVRCDPGDEACVSAWAARKGDEYLKTEKQLRQVHSDYRGPFWHTQLLTVDYDYMNQPEFHAPEVLDNFRAPLHPLGVASAGNWLGNIVLVGEAFAEVKNDDLVYQWPFASFSNQGCSRWLTAKLWEAGINENNLAWINADQLDRFVIPPDAAVEVIALGGEASKTLTACGLKHHTVAHPSYWHRFHNGSPYELTTLIKELV